MIKEKMSMWDKIPGMCEENPCITVYIPENKKSEGAVVIFPGGGYQMRADYEGEGYAVFLAEHGVTAFVCDYRVAPHKFPLPLLDGRRAVRWVRSNAEKYGLDKNKIYVMGSSAGGHLAALVSTYRGEIEFEGADETDKEDYLPNGQILCYPVIKLLGSGIAHLGSGANLLGEMHAMIGEQCSPDLIADEKTPKAFIWHTFDDNAVNVINSLDYAKKLRTLNVDTEMHIYPNGVHGLGLCEPSHYAAAWSSELLRWLEYNGMINE